MIIDGKRIAAQIKDEVREEVGRLRERGIGIGLSVIRVGDDPASEVYVRNKERACEYAGIRASTIALPGDTGEEELVSLVTRLNADDMTDGILVQLPLPPQIDAGRVLMAIDPAKDVDGFHPVNVGKMQIGRDSFLPCTPAGVIELLRRSGISIEGKECVVVGRSNIVGKPMAALLLRENGTVTVAHSRTRNLKEVARRADILILAIGKAKYITADYVKPGAVLVDVGMNRGADKKLCGDADFDSVSRVASAVTPVPGGVGPMTVAMLLKNCVKAARGKIS